LPKRIYMLQRDQNRPHKQSSLE